MIKRILPAVLCGLILVGAAFGQQSKLVGNIKGEDGGACADFFRFAAEPDSSSKLIFYRSLGNEKEIWMNIDGTDVRLKFISRSEPTKPDETGGEMLGSRTTEKFTARRIAVTIIFTVSWLCPNDNAAAGCESIGYTAVFKVRKGRRRQTVKAVGASGC